MAVRQYIGARYVPKFMGNYDATQNYEALSVVDNGMGTSYIAKVPTPPNTPLTDTNYWAIYGASSGAIINIQNQIDDMNDGNVAGSLQNQINIISDDVETIKIKQSGKFLLIGDSVCTSSYVNSNNRSVYQVFGDHMNLTENTDYYIKAIGARGFTTTQTPEANFETMFDSFWIDHPNLDPNDFKVIIVTGGANDQTKTPAEIGYAIESFINNAKIKCPNAEIYIGVSVRVNLNYTGVANFKNHYLPGYKKCELYGARFLHGLEFVIYDNRLQVDGLHPNADGVDAIGLGIFQSFTSGKAHIERYLTRNDSNMIESSGVTSITNKAVFSEVQIDDMLYISPDTFGSVVITLDSAFTGGAKEIASCTDELWKCETPNGLAAMNVPCVYLNSDGQNVVLTDVVLYKQANKWTLVSSVGFNNAMSITIKRPLGDSKHALLAT